MSAGSRLRAVPWLLLGVSVLFILHGCSKGKKEEYTDDGTDQTVPTVVSIDPADGTSGVSTGSTITIVFSEAIPPQNVTVNSDGECTKNVQVSKDSFVSCLPMSSANSSSTNFTLTPKTNNKFPSNSSFSIKISKNIQDYSGLGLANDYSSSFSTAAVCASGCSWSEVTDVGDLTGRSGHAAVAYNGYIWVLGGYDASSSYTSTVMTTTSGTFNKMTDSPGWTGRFNHVALSFNGSMWVFGGHDGNNILADAWSSTNGTSWGSKTSLPSARTQHAGTVFNGKMWIMGGQSGETERLNDVHSSSDGTTWTQVTSSAAWSKRYGHAVVAYAGKLWLFGGNDGSQYLNDVWYSADGSSWTQASDASWSARSGHQATVFEGKVWIMGGADSNGPKQEAYTFNGSSWSTVSVSWSQRTNFASVVSDNKIWVIGGDKGTSSNRELSDVWKYGK